MSYSNLFVSSIANSNISKSNIASLQKSLNQVTQEVSSGKKYDIAASLGSKTPTLVGLKNSVTEMEGYQSSINTVSNRLSVMQNSLTNIISSVSDYLITAKTATNDEVSEEFIQGVSQNILEQTTQFLNVDISGRKLFSGKDTSTKPMEYNFNLANDALNDAATLKGAPLEVGDIAGLVSDLNDMFNDTHADTTKHYTGTFFKADTSTGNVTTRIDENTNLEYGVAADEQAFRDLIQGMHMLANVSNNSANLTESAYNEYVSQAVQKLESGLKDVTQIAAELGLKENTVEKTKLRHQNTIDTINSQIAAFENIDPAEASVRLNNISAQLEVTYLITSKINNLSLVNYL